MNTDDELRHPRITKAYAKSLIVAEKIYIDNDMSVVVCIVKLKNGHRVVGDAIVGNNHAFDPERGTTIAREKVIEKIMLHEMYLLRSKLTERRAKEQPDAD